MNIQQNTLYMLHFFGSSLADQQKFNTPFGYQLLTISVWENHLNMNTNNIRFEKLHEYEYE